MRKWTSLGLAVAAITMTSTPPAAQQASSSWNGFYAGLNAGGLFGSTWSHFATPGGPGGLSGSGGGFVGGAQAGYNYLFGPVLLGGEIDFQGSTFAAGLNGGAGRGPSRPPNTRRGSARCACAPAIRWARSCLT